MDLLKLRDAGLIRGDIDGPRTCYCLDARAVAEAETALAGLFGRLRPKAGRANPPSAAKVKKETS